MEYLHIIMATYPIDIIDINLEIIEYLLRQCLQDPNDLVRKAARVVFVNQYEKTFALRADRFFHNLESCTKKAIVNERDC